MLCSASLWSYDYVTRGGNVTHSDHIFIFLCAFAFYDEVCFFLYIFESLKFEV